MPCVSTHSTLRRVSYSLASVRRRRRVKGETATDGCIGERERKVDGRSQVGVDE